MPLFVRKRLDGEGKADGSQYMICTGSVSRDPRIGAIPKNNLPKVEFGMGYDSKQFMNLCAVGDNAATKLSACLEKGDAVCVVGTWRQKPYTTKDGEAKVWSELRADHVIPLGALETLLQVPVEVFLRLADLLPQLEKLCAGETPTGQPSRTQNTAQQSAAALHEMEEDEPLPWDRDGADEDYDLGI